jgi:ABC-type protease/lipase transport system fused ATPase/permease subunit
MPPSEIEPATCFELTQKWGRLWIATFKYVYIYVCVYVITIHMYVYIDVIIYILFYICDYLFVYIYIYMCVCYYIYMLLCICIWLSSIICIWLSLLYIYTYTRRKNNKSNKSQGLSETDHISVRLSGWVSPAISWWQTDKHERLNQHNVNKTGWQTITNNWHLINND